MKYTIVWNKDKTEGIILSGEDAYNDAKAALAGRCHLAWYSEVASEFYETYITDGGCTIQQVEEI